METKVNKGLRVAHISRDNAGNIHSREGWIISGKMVTKNTLTVIYADSGESAEVPVGEIHILGVAKNSKILVEHKMPNSNEIKRGYLLGGVEEDKVKVLFENEKEPTTVPVKELLLLGEEV